MAERKTVRRWFWIYEFEKEEEWLCSMAMEGWVLMYCLGRIHGKTEDLKRERTLHE